jgi:hypothetical protein
VPGRRPYCATRVRRCQSFHVLPLTVIDTHLFGMGSAEDGLWRDKDGKPAKFAIGPDPGRFSWLTGAFGAVQRVRGAGGF